ncbi:MAG: hypothetical protein ACE5FU_09185 [Nitrospinota bacterium]
MVTIQANELVETVIKPKSIEPPPEDGNLNYLVDIYTKWHRNYFYFCSKYCCPSSSAISPSFESKFARMEYVGDDCFNLSYMRHTDQWWELFPEQSLDDCLEAIKEQPHFMP